MAALRVLVSGAGIAGPVLAYWLARCGVQVAVVERATTLRRTGGHAVDLFRPAMEISDRMGVRASIEERATGNDLMVAYRNGSDRPACIDLRPVYRAVSDRHVEIMRDDLSEIFYEATRDDVEYVFGDSITTIDADGGVTFEAGPPRRFDLVVGADGLHSGVRRLTFGPEDRFARFLGAYLAVLSLPGRYSRAGEFTLQLGPGRMAGLYGARREGDARAVFLLRTDGELGIDHRDTARQKAALRDAFGGWHDRVDGWLAELDGGGAFYFDTITQLQLDTWGRDRVILVGDAAYCPGPAVGGSTSLAVLGAYTLAGELAAAAGDHVRALAGYQRTLAEPVQASRVLARSMARSLVPASRAGVWALVSGARLVAALPPALARAIARRTARGVRVHDSMPVGNYAMAPIPGP